MTSQLPWSERVRRAAEALPDHVVISDWHAVSQRAIDQYAASVEDPDPVHVDPEWARANTPYGGTIAAGMWGASLLVVMLHRTKFLRAIEQELGTSFGLNYGFDRLRFVNPIPEGSRIRGHFTFVGLARHGEYGAMLRVAVSVEIENAERPALVGDWLLYWFDPASARTEEVAG